VVNIHAVIFDMDGLLIDSEPIWRQSEIEIFGRLGLHLTEEQCMQTMGVRVAQVVQLWYDRHPWEGPSTEDVTAQIIDAVKAHIMTQGEPMPGVLRTLAMVQTAGLPMAIASSSSEDLIRAVVERLGIDPYVSAIFTAEDDPEGKPHPAVYLRAAISLGVAPEDCLAFEDSPNGILAAKNAGMTCIVVPDPYLAGDPRMNLADMRLESLEDFTPDLFAQFMQSGIIEKP
jgi:HAD superfamily hydrolase (TIGR01509 family)